jgi:O-antigen/teichoic acid export membrane protein
MAAASHSIAFNTLVLWARIAATMAATIFATRFALLALGVDAFGVYAAIASLPLMLGFLTGAMGAVTQRMLASGLAKEPSGMRRIFNASLGPHLAIALLIVAAGETLGVWLLENALSMPDELRGSARIALRISVAAAALGAFLAPYETLLQTRERFAPFAVLDIFRSLIVLIGSWMLLDYSGDRLLGYATVQAAAAASAMLIGSLIAAWQYPESRLRPLQMIDRSELRQRLGLFSWTIFGSLATIARIQGFVVLANVLFGPAASAALGVGNQLIGVLRQLSTAVSQAVTPKIYMIEAAGERSQMIGAALLACKYAGLIGAILAAPLMIELPTVLGLWLGSPPPGASEAIALLTIAFLLDQLSYSIGVAHLAIGRIALYQLVCGLVTIAALPLGYVAAKLGGGLPDALTALVATSGLVAVLRLFLLETHSPGAVRSWLRTTTAPVTFAFGAGLLAGLAVASLLEPSFARVIATTIASSAALLAVTYVSLDTLEKTTLETLILRRLFRGTAR